MKRRAMVCSPRHMLQSSEIRRNNPSKQEQKSQVRQRREAALRTVTMVRDIALTSSENGRLPEWQCFCRSVLSTQAVASNPFTECEAAHTSAGIERTIILLRPDLAAALPRTAPSRPSLARL